MAGRRENLAAIGYRKRNGVDKEMEAKGYQQNFAFASLQRISAISILAQLEFEIFPIKFLTDCGRIPLTESHKTLAQSNPVRIGGFSFPFFRAKKSGKRRHSHSTSYQSNGK